MSPLFTGRFIYTIRDPARAAVFAQSRGTPSTAEGFGALAEMVEAGGTVQLGTSGIFVVDPRVDAGAAEALQALDGVDFEPDRYQFAVGQPDPEYLRGLRDGLNLALGEFGDGPGDPAAARRRSRGSKSGTPARPRFEDDAVATWGLRATGALASVLDGTGISVAVLDTGIDHTHPCFGARVTAKSFVGGDTMDRHGHGTHCAGTIAGEGAPRFGIAPAAHILAGKVLGDDGRGSVAEILAGMLWAIDQGATIISMSLGGPPLPGGRWSPAYEQMAARALSRGSLVVAAAGNDSLRSWGFLRGVSEPADVPSALAVAAVEPDLDVADFSNAGLVAGGGEIDIAGPGVDILSAAPGGGVQRMNGTSMATPHVAGIAALLAQSDASLRGRALWDALTRRAMRLPGAVARDIGAGLVHV